jgi:hypothetical protein
VTRRRVLDHSRGRGVVEGPRVGRGIGTRQHEVRGGRAAVVRLGAEGHVGGPPRGDEDVVRVEGASRRRRPRPPR